MKKFNLLLSTLFSVLSFMAIAYLFQFNAFFLGVAIIATMLFAGTKEKNMAFMAMDNMNARLIYENAKQLLLRNGKNPETAILSQSYIRSEILIDANTAQYQVQSIVNQPNNSGVIYPTEKRLALQDWFITSSIGIFLGVPASATDNKWRLYAFPSTNVFSAANTAAAAYTLYNGFLSLTVDNRVVIPEWDIERSLYIPQQQAANDAYYATSGINFQSQFDGEAGFYPAEPNYIINGAANIDMKINLPSAIATVQTNSRIVVIQRGVKAQNVTNVK